MSKKALNIIFRISLLVALILVVFNLTSYVSSNDSVQDIISKFGYLGIFSMSAISGFNLIVPIPIATFVPVFLESGFEFWKVIFIIAMGMTTGDLLSYVIGIVGRKFILEENLNNNWFIHKIVKAREKYKILPYVLLFIFISFIPLPNEITVLPMGLLGYRLTIIIPILVVGNLIFNFLAANGILALFNII